MKQLQIVTSSKKKQGNKIENGGGICFKVIRADFSNEVTFKLNLSFKKIWLLILGGERNINVREKHRLVASHMHPDQEWNPQPFGVQDDAPTEPHQPGPS